MSNVIQTAKTLNTSNTKNNLFIVYWWCISYLKPYRWVLFWVILFTFAISLCELLIPKFIQYFIDEIVPSKNSNAFFVLLVIMFGIVIIMFTCRAMQNLLQRSLQEKAARDLQYSIFRHLRNLGFSYFERHPIGETLSFLNTEVSAVQELYRHRFPGLINGAVFSLVSIGLMLSVSTKLTLIVLPFFLLYYSIGPILERKASVSGKDMAENRVQYNQKTYESISALAELRCYSSEGWDLNRFLEKLNAFNQSMIQTYWYAYWRGTFRRLSYYAGGLVMFIYGFYLMKQMSLSVGGLVSFLLYYFITMHRLTVVITNITEQKILMYQAERLYQFIKTPPDVAEPERPTYLDKIVGEISFHDVGFAYVENQPILNGFTLQVKAGQRTALVGTSGNGKSTALKLIGRFYDPQQGVINLDGVPIHQLSFSQLRGNLGYVFQETYLFGTTVKENIRFGKPESTDEEIIQAAKAAYAHEFIMLLPQGYDTHVGERGIKLSGGQKQRIAISRMFLKNPTILLLDEATSALDNVSEIEVQKALNELFKGRTIITVAHRLSTIQDYETIVVIDQGRVAEKGTYEDLLRQRGLFYLLVKGETSQMEVVHE